MRDPNPYVMIRWLIGTRYMRIDRLHVLQQQVLKMASGVANIKRSSNKFNSLGLQGYFFSLDHLQAACQIDGYVWNNFALFQVNGVD